MLTDLARQMIVRFLFFFYFFAQGSLLQLHLMFNDPAYAFITETILVLQQVASVCVATGGESPTSNRDPVTARRV